MPEFANPFSGKVPERKLTREELIRAIRLNIAAEHEAVHLYMAHAQATDDPIARAVLVDVANEEREHIGEFMRLIEILTDGEETELLEAGREEVNEMLEGMGRSAYSGNGERRGAPPVDVTRPTIGSLKEGGS
jgi:rubrerythrin